ncbi:MAG: serine/threonine protein kinase [Acidobacteria bacterium]|nr:MAG: serine/threonine protein kinase [Acidobacteriota bacterium]
MTSRDQGAEPITTRDQRLAEAIAEYSDLEAEGQEVQLSEFCRRHPDLAPDLQACLESLAPLDGLRDERATIRESTSPFEIQTLSGLRILQQIGSGGMGQVFLALDERLDRKVAVKMLASRFWGNQGLRSRFMQEARALARLNHPRIVRIYDLGGTAEPPHFVMEYVEGVPLVAALKPLPLEARTKVMQKVVRAVQFLHEHHIVHRDLKPGNILVDSDLEPKLLDFGLARHVEHSSSLGLTRPGEVVGTPEYFSPEQARAEASDARSDVFSLGTVLFQVLTGQLPFPAEDYEGQIRSICEAEPVLPRRLDPSIPGELQNICMKALEKNPADRYTSAREMADDLERFLAGEPVLATPSSYSRRMAGKVEQHLRELAGWRQDRILSDTEFDVLEKGYGRLIEKEDAWIMEVRRLSLPQVTLYLGAWLVVVAAALVFLFRYPALAGTPAVLIVAGVALPSGAYGLHCWRAGRLRIAIAYLLAFCLLTPVVLLVAMGEYGLFSGLTQNRKDLEFFYQFDSFKRTTNAQLWWSLLFSLPVFVVLRRFTGSSVFSLVLSVMTGLLCLVTLLRLGMIEWIPDHTGKIFLRLIPAALLFFFAGGVLERLKRPADSRYFYPMAVFFTFASLSGLAAFHEPYAHWLQSVLPWTRGQVEYLFIVNAGIYAVLQWICERLPSPQMRTVATSFRFVIPTHVLTSLLLLGLRATERSEANSASLSLLREARLFEVLLPLTALVFVFWSLPKQMKNYLATGLIFLAVGIIRLQQNWLSDRVGWPLILLLAGSLLMLAGARYSSWRAALARLFRR